MGHVLCLGGLSGGAVVLGGGEEPEPLADDLGVEVGRQFGPVVGKTTDAQVPAQARRGEVDVLLTNSL